MSDEHLRISDVEREQAAAALADHYAAGRLTMPEHSERLDRIWAARTRAELRPLFSDLPPPHGPLLPTTPVRGVTSRAPRRGLPVPLVVLLVVLLAVTVTTHLPFILLGLVIYLLLRSRARSPPCR